MLPSSTADQLRLEKYARRTKRPHMRTRVFPLVLPSMILVGLVFLIPVLTVIWVSLHQTNYFDIGSFVGLGQYASLVVNAEFGQQVLVTLAYVFGSLVLSVVCGFGIALFLQSAGRLRIFFRTALLLPWALSQATVAIAWVWILNPSYGPVAYYLKELGLPNSLLLGSPTLALPLLILVTSWWATPYATVLFDAGLQSMPAELYEAAAIDGANARRSFVNLTLPLMRSTTATVSLFLTMMFFAMVTLPFVLTGGGPLGATNTLSLNVYTQTIISGQNVGEGASVSVLILLANVLFGLAMMRQGRDKT